MINSLCEPVPCAHIADYYEREMAFRPNLGNNLLRIGYRQWAEGRVQDRKLNNLYSCAEDQDIVRALMLEGDTLEDANNVLEWVHRNPSAWKETIAHARSLEQWRNETGQLILDKVILLDTLRQVRDCAVEETVTWGSTGDKVIPHQIFELVEETLRKIDERNRET